MAVNFDDLTLEDSSESEGNTETNPLYIETKERFANEIRNFVSEAADRIDTDIIQERNNLEEYIRRERESRWRINELEQQKATVEDANADRHDNYLAQFDALLRHNKVDAVGFDGESNLLIKTVELDMTHPDTLETKRLGAFEINIPITANAAREMRVVNRTNAKEVEGEIWQHPHVEHEFPCYGALEAELIDSLSAGEFSAAFELLLQYLQSINPQDSYADHWDWW